MCTFYLTRPAYLNQRRLLSQARGIRRASACSPRPRTARRGALQATPPSQRVGRPTRGRGSRDSMDQSSAAGTREARPRRAPTLRPARRSL
eukprot:scaffold41668_cov63-Phaeocystis_antarctica.AAC.3